MANLTETSRWEAGIYQWETSDPVQGGPNGIDNRPTRELANRTRWLYDQMQKKLGNSGNQRLDGILELKTTEWEKIRFTNGDGSYWRFETAPVSTGENGARFNYVFTSGGREIGRVQFPRVSGSESVAYQGWVEANAARLATDKMNVATTNYYVDQSGGYTKSGFYRSNGRQLDGNALPAMEIHIAHPEVVNGAHARGIGFSYGSSSNPFQLVTSAWDGNGRYIGMKTVLTEENGVMLSNDQTVGGVKTFTSKAVFSGGLSVSGNGKSADIHTGPGDIYLRNSKSNKYLQLKDGPVEGGGYDCISSSVRDGGVRAKTMLLPADKWDLIPLPDSINEHGQLDRLYRNTVSQPYDWFGAVGVVFKTRQRGDKWFCSEWCAAALGLPDCWRWSPNDLAAIVSALFQREAQPRHTIGLSMSC